MLATACNDNGLRLIDARNGKISQKWTVENVAVCSAWSPDGRFLAVGSYDQSVRVFALETRTLLYTISGESGVHSVAWSPNGLLLASGWRNGKLRQCHAHSGKLLAAPQG